MKRQISPLGVRQTQWMDDRMAATRRLTEALVRRGARGAAHHPAVYSPSEWKEIQERGFVRNEVLGRGVILH